MPELPDVEIQRQLVESTALGRRIETVEVRDEYLVKGVEPDELRGRLEGDAFRRARRHGKYLFVETKGGTWVLFHFGMSGFLRYYEDPEGEPEYPKVVWLFEDDGALAFDCRRKLGVVRLVDGPEAFAREKGLGPDALSDALDRQAFREAMIGRRGMVKTALMNQEILAGIGNEFSDEILFQMELHPRTKVSDLGEGRVDRLYDTLRHTLKAAIQARMDPEQLPGRFLLPRRDEEAACPRCGAGVRRIEVSGRGSYFCPACQGEEPG